MKLLIGYDGLQGKPPVTLTQEAFDLRLTELQDVELMDIYESKQPELISVLRKHIDDAGVNAIIVVGSSDEYRWVGTIVCRIYGQFSSWNGQRQNDYGITELNINGNSVKVVAIDSWDALDRAIEVLKK